MNHKNDIESGFIKSTARRAFKPITKTPLFTIEKRYNSRNDSSPIHKTNYTKIAAGFVIGIAVSFGISALGIDLGNTGTAFLALQFGLIGGLMTYINS